MTSRPWMACTFVLLAGAAAADVSYEVTTPGKAGGSGVTPVLAGSGVPTAGSAGNALLLSDAPPGGFATLVFGASELAAPFQGGILGPNPQIVLGGLPVDGAGELDVPFAMPETAATGLELWFQVWIFDPAAPFDLPASNTLKLTVPDASLGDALFPGRRFPSLDGSYAVVVSDWNDDGHPDLAVRGANGTTDVDVLLGAGNGSFCPSVSYPAGGVSTTLVTGDLDQDGRTDLVTLGTEVEVLLGTGSGAFAPPVSSPATAAPVGISLGDANADGILDAAVSDLLGDSASILIGAGDGTFGPPTTYPVGTRPRSLTFGDFDGDGSADLAAANDLSDDVSVLLGTGGGAFGPTSTIPVGNGPRQVIAADLDGDGATDLVTGNHSDASVLLGAGDGTFAAAASLSGVSGSRGLVGSDVNADGLVDLVLSQGTSIAVAAGVGDGTFVAPEEFVAGYDSQGIAVADVNGDAVPDVEAADSFEDAVSVLLGAGGGAFESVTNPPTGKSPRSVRTADLNGDSLPDVVTANFDSDDVSVLLGTGGGELAPAASFALGGTRSQPQALALGDLNGDGVQDLVVSHLNPYGLSAWLGVGDGTFGSAATYASGLTSHVSALAIGDVDGDGDADVVAARSSVLGEVEVYLGAGDGTLAAPTVHPTGNGTSNSVAIEDLNGDGLADLVTAGSSSGVAWVLLGTGGGSFGAATSFAAGSGTRFVAAGDVDADGELDLAAANFGAGEAAVLLGHGDGTFAAPVGHAVGAQPEALSVADLDDDGAPDLAATSIQGSVWVLQGANDGSFSLPSVHTAGAVAPGGGIGMDTTSLAVSDLDGDGKLDLVLGNELGNDVTVLINRL